jgi:hypothetical protein
MDIHKYLVSFKLSLGFFLFFEGKEISLEHKERHLLTRVQLKIIPSIDNLV